MKRIFIIALLLANCEVKAQLDIRVGISQNFYNINFGSNSDYFYGGAGNNSVGPVVDFEYHRKKHYWMKKDTVLSMKKLMLTLHSSILMGFHYTYHTHTVSGVNQVDDDIFSNWNNKYLHIPLIYKINFQPLILDENFHMSFGIGVVNSFLVSSTLEERATIYTRDSEGEILDQQFVSDQANVKPYAKKYIPMLGLEMSGSFKRLYIAIRAWLNFSDQYMSGLENNWQVPIEQSVYLGSYQRWDKITYTGGGFVLGWKIN